MILGRRTVLFTRKVPSVGVDRTLDKPHPPRPKALFIGRRSRSADYRRKREAKWGAVGNAGAPGRAGERAPGPARAIPRGGPCPLQPQAAEVSPTGDPGRALDGAVRHAPLEPGPGAAVAGGQQRCAGIGESRISSAVLAQANGRGFGFQFPIQAWMSASRGKTVGERLGIPEESRVLVRRAVRYTRPAGGDAPGETAASLADEYYSYDLARDSPLASAAPASPVEILAGLGHKLLRHVDEI